MRAAMKAFVISEKDNVATALQKTPVQSKIELVGISSGTFLCSANEIPAEHKIALKPIAKNEPVIKYGIVIGTATEPIQSGEWVHLHNCKSNYDERSNTLDAQTGAPTEEDVYV